MTDPQKIDIPRRLGFESRAPLGAKQIDHVRWRTTHRLVFRYRSDAGVVLDVEVKPDYETDFASGPDACRGLMPKSGRYNPATIIHDHLCDEALAGRFCRRDADRIFRDAMADLDRDQPGRKGTTRRWVIWAAVRWGALVAHPGQWRDFARDLPAVWPLTLLALPVVTPAAVATQVTLWVIAAWEAVERRIIRRQTNEQEATP